MNPQFEQKVNDSLETAVYNPNIVIQPSPQARINKDFNRKIILIFTFAIICFALLIIIRGVLLQNPATFDNSSIIGQILNPNGATGLRGLEITQAESILNDFTGKVKSEYQSLPSNDYRTLLLKTANASTIGNLSKNGSFSKTIEFSNAIEVFRFYDDQNFLYAINPPNIGLSELYLNTAGNQPVMVKRLEKDQKFIDAHYSNLDKTFYYSYYDNNNTVFIGATNLKGTQFELYKTNFLNTSAAIWSVDTSAGYIYLNQQRECFSLQLRDKILNSYECEKIKSNNDNNFYWTNESSTGVYTSFDRGELYKFTYGELRRKVLTTKINGQVIKKLWLSGDNIYYILEDLIPAGNTKWNTQPKDIQYTNVMNAQEGSLNIKNMRSDIYAIIPMDELFIVTEEFFGTSGLYRYIPNPEFPEPASYPGSYPASYVQEVNPQEYYWQKVDLGVGYDTVEVIQPQYTFDF